MGGGREEKAEKMRKVRERGCLSIKLLRRNRELSPSRDGRWA